MPDEHSAGENLVHALLLQLSAQVDEVSAKVGLINGDVLSIKTTLARIVPLVDNHERHMNRSAGVRDRGRLIWGGLITSLAGGVGGLMTFMIQRLTSGSAPDH